MAILKTAGENGVHLADRSTADLVRELGAHSRRLIECEIELVKTELRRELERTRGELGDTRDHLVADGRAAIAEARDRLTRNAEALRADVKEQLDRAAAAAKPLTVGSVLAHAGLLLLLAALTLGLATLMPAWVAALIVGVVAAGVGAAMLAGGVRMAKDVGREPLARTQTQMTENKRWMTETKGTLMARMRSVKSTLSAIALPRLHLSSGGGRGPST